MISAVGHPFKNTYFHNAGSQPARKARCEDPAATKEALNKVVGYLTSKGLSYLIQLPLPKVASEAAKKTQDYVADKAADNVINKPEAQQEPSTNLNYSIQTTPPKK